MSKVITILYVEDEPDDVFFMQKACKKVLPDCRLQSVSDGQKAIEYLAGTADFGDRSRYPFPHLVLLDLNLPARPGFEVLQWIRQQPGYGKIPVIVFSSSGRMEDRARAAVLGATDYIAKPSSGLEFSTVVHQLNDRWLKVLFPRKTHKEGAGLSSR